MGETAREYFADRSKVQLEKIVASLDERTICLAIALDIPALRMIDRLRPEFPLLFRVHADPVAEGIVDGYARTGRRYSGVTTFANVDAKMMEFSLDAFTVGKVFGYVFDSREGPAKVAIAAMRRIAEQRKVAFVPLDYARWATIESLEYELDRSKIDVGVVGANSSTWPLRRAIAEAFAARRIAAVFESPMFVADKSPIGFGSSSAEGAARLAEMSVRVLDGEAPASFPVLRPTQFDVTLNIPVIRERGYRVSTAAARRATRTLDGP